MITKVLMVCLGNICRSPLAEGILKNKVDPQSVFVDSAGTGSYHIGKTPDPRSIDVALKHGIDISQQRCRQFETIDFNTFDIIYVMDKSNYSNVIAKSKTKEDIQKVKLLLSEIDLNSIEVPDPYYDQQDGFEHVYQLIEKACEIIADNLSLK